MVRNLSGKKKKVQSLSLSWFLGLDLNLYTVKFHAAQWHFPHSHRANLQRAFFSPAINQQCVFDGVYDPDSPPRSRFLHWITEFLPFTTRRPPALHLICLSSEPWTHFSQNHLLTGSSGGSETLFIPGFMFSKGWTVSDGRLDITVWEKVWGWKLETLQRREQNTSHS